MLTPVHPSLGMPGHLHGKRGPQSLDDLQIGPVAEAEHVGAVVRDVDQHVIGPGDHAIEQHPVPVAPLAAGPDLDSLLYQRLFGAALATVLLPSPGQLEVHGVGRGQLLRPLHEGRGLMLVVGALGLRQELADPVDQPIAAGLRPRCRLRSRHSAPTSTSCSP